MNALSPSRSLFGMMCSLKLSESREVPMRGCTDKSLGLAIGKQRTHEDHRHALGDHESEVQVAHLALAQRVHARVVGLALHAAVPGEVVVGAVAVALAVGIVVLLVVGHQIVQREAIMRDDEVDPVRRLPAQRSAAHNISFRGFLF